MDLEEDLDKKKEKRTNLTVVCLAIPIHYIKDLAIYG